MAESKNHDNVAKHAILCKLPLLDGEKGPQAGPITVDVEPESLGRLQRMIPSDRSGLKGMICAGWGLLLRCYTGQDEVCFNFRQQSGGLPGNIPFAQQDTRSSLGITFSSEGKLLDLVSRLQEQVAVPEQQQQLNQEVTLYMTSETAMTISNTTVWYQEEDLSSRWRPSHPPEEIQVRSLILA